MSWRDAMARARAASSEWAAEEGGGGPEPVNRYWMELDCTPSTWAEIAEFVRSRPTANRKARFHPLEEKGKRS